MRRSYFLPLSAWLWILLLLTPTERAWAVINAGLQPYDLFTSRYSRALVLEVTEVDPSSGLLKTSLVNTYKGEPESETEVSIQFDASLLGVLADALSDGDFQKGDPIVVFAGRKRAKKDFMLYANSFYLGKIESPGNWTIDRTGQGAVGMSGEQLNTLAGTWNGSTPQLVRMLEDMAAGIDFFPRKAYVQFKDDILLDRLESGVTALAVFDIEGDGDEDIVACSDVGNKVYLQTDPMVFVNATESLKLSGGSPSVALADFDGDGLNDLLAGTTLYQGQFEDNRFYFVKTELLPERSASKL
ncbi:MAG: VCBS repeat-containing protein, partial [Verrucomicrobiota bacterium]